MSTEHNHKTCKHKKIKYCKACRVAYCTKCGQEWSERSCTWAYPYVYSSVMSGETNVCEGHTVYDEISYKEKDV